MVFWFMVEPLLCIWFKIMWNKVIIGLFIINIFNFGSFCYALGSNITIECLQQTLIRLQRMRIPIPSHLDLQLDNTTKQNKNKDTKKGVAAA